MLASGWLVYGMSVADRFGSNGLIRVAIVSPTDLDTWEIDSFVMSLPGDGPRDRDSFAC